MQDRSLAMSEASMDTSITGNGKLEELARRNEAALLGAVLGVELVMGDVANAKSWDINGEKAVISVEKV